LMTLAAFLEKNLFAILSSLIMGLLAYAVGTTNTAGTIRDLTKRVETLEKRVEASAAYHQCATRHLDMIERGDKTNPPCELGGM
jgi:hypothetical protein